MAEKEVKIVVTAEDRATPVISRVASGVKGAVDNMRSSIKSWIDDTALASAAFTALFTKVAKGAIDTAADFEKAGIMTRFLTDNTEAANKYSQALIDLALTTPFTTKEITTLGSRMIGQVKDVDISVLGMKALTNAVSATGGGIMELENSQRALTQTFIKAKPSLEELNKQFNNANIPVMRALSKHLADGTVKLKGYTDAVVVTGGASKKLAGDATKAGEVIEDSAFKTDKLTAAMNKAKNKFGESSYQFKEAKDKLGDWNEKVAGAQGTIEKYNSALGSTTKTISGFHKTQEQIMADLQDVANLGVTGKDTAVAIMEALALEYAGANETMLNSFSGLTRNIVDQIQVVSASIMGIDKNLNVREGSIFYYLKLGAKSLSEFLAAHRYDIADFVDSLLKNKVAMMSIATIIVSMMIPAFVKLNKFLGLTKLLLGGLTLTPFVLIMAGAISLLLANTDRIQRIKDKMAFGTTETGNVHATWQQALKGIAIRIENLVDSPQMQRIKDKLAFGTTDTGTIHATWQQALEGIKIRVQNFSENYIGPLIQRMKNNLYWSITDTVKADTTWMDILEGIKDRINRYVGIIGQKIQEMKNMFVFGEIAPPIPATWMNVLEKVKILLEQVKQKLSELKAKAKSEIDSIIQFWNEHREAITKTAQAITVFFLPAIIALGIAMATNAIRAAITLTLQFIAMKNAAAQAAFTGIGQLIYQTIQFGIQGWKTIVVLAAQAVAWTTSTLLKTANAVATGSLTIATVAQAIATGVLTAATWLLNTALSILFAPLTIIIVAITTIIAIFLQWAGLLDNVIGGLRGLLSSIFGLNPQLDLYRQNLDLSKSSTDSLAAATDILTGAHDRATDANLELRGAQLGVDNAQRMVTDALNTYGENSPQYRDNVHNLDLANRRLEKAEEGVEGAQRDIMKAQDDYAKDVKEKAVPTVTFFNRYLDSHKSKWQELADAINSVISNILRWTGLKGQHGASGQWQHGGIVPGPIGQPMPAIVHGGERITPRGGVDESAKSMGGDGITININGSVTMDSEERVRELARLIMRMLGRESELSRYGVGY